MKAKNVSSDIKYKRLIEPSRIHPINSYIFYSGVSPKTMSTIGKRVLILL